MQSFRKRFEEKVTPKMLIIEEGISCVFGKKKEYYIGRLEQANR